MNYFRQNVEAKLAFTAGYSTWLQVGAYFDGDGTVGLDVQLFTLGLYLEFTDNWLPQLEMVNRFLTQSAVNTYSPAAQPKNGAFTLKVLRVPDVVEVTKRILPYIWKKESELRTVVDYYGGRLTGDQAVEVFNQEVRVRKRTGRERLVSVPYTYEEGRRLALELSTRRAAEINIVQVPKQIRQAIIRNYLFPGISQEKLALKYGFSRTVIRRILGAK